MRFISVYFLFVIGFCCLFQVPSKPKSVIKKETKVEKINVDRVVVEIERVMEERVNYCNSDAAGFGSGEMKIWQQMGYKSALDCAKFSDANYQLCERLLAAGEKK